jgi:plasmid stability protein
MPRNLTIKGLPDEVYERLKDTAERNNRSVNSEGTSVIVDAKVLASRATSGKGARHAEVAPTSFPIDRSVRSPTPSPRPSPPVTGEREQEGALSRLRERVGVRVEAW